MLDAGVHFAPSAYEAGFVSSAHGPEVIKTTLATAQAAFAQLKS
jgi:glutamate-1-semialdehyde 2,1-aminomutase